MYSCVSAKEVDIDRLVERVLQDLLRLTRSGRSVLKVYFIFSIIALNDLSAEVSINFNDGGGVVVAELYQF